MVVVVGGEKDGESASRCLNKNHGLVVVVEEDKKVTAIRMMV